MKKFIFILSLITIFASKNSFTQEAISSSNIHGNFSLEGQYYITDSAINAYEVKERILSNSFLNLIYTNGNFTTGVRYEAYLGPMKGYDEAYAGNGVPYRFASYKKDELEVTVGNFYDQFGNGLIFRSYEEKTLGIDNAIDGIRVKYTPVNGITLKGIMGNQRIYWTKSAGIIRGFDGEFMLNDICKKLQNSKTKIILGGSAVSKYQKDKPTSKYKLPVNVAAFAGRFDVSRGKFALQGEYAYKINDPSALNNYIYKPGEALFLSGSYSQKGLGIILAAKRIDNMNFRTDRDMIGNPLTISFLPSISKQHTYSLAALYPYSTQPNGEIGVFGQVSYMVKKGTKLGGKYGTDVSFNFSKINNIKKEKVAPGIAIDSAGTLGYKSDFFAIGDEAYFQDFNIEVTHKFNKHWKAIFTYMNLMYNISVIENHEGPNIYANVGIADVTYKFNDKNALRVELQSMMTKQDKKDWFTGLVEYTIAPKWFFSVMDQYNYGNEDSDKRFHYYMAAIGYTKGSNRIALQYGRQREGIVCVGGICRAVPASNGFQISITSSF
jgi:hypothetical protein